MARIPVEPSPKTIRTDGQRTGPGEAHRLTATTKHNGDAARLRISAKEPFEGLLLDMQNEIADQMGLSDQIEAGGYVGDMCLTLVRLCVARQCFWDAALMSASIPDVKSWSSYMDKHRRWAVQTLKVEMQLMTLDQADDVGLVILDAIQASQEGR